MHHHGVKAAKPIWMALNVLLYDANEMQFRLWWFLSENTQQNQFQLQSLGISTQN